MGAPDMPTARTTAAHDTPIARAAEAPQPCHGISARARKRGAPAPLTNHDSPAMPMLGRPASQLQTCHGKPMASTKTCLDIVPQQDFGHQPSQPVEDDQEWLPTAATSGGGAPPPLAVTERDVTSMAGGVEGASPPMEEYGGGATV
ncbi:hypothetical protein CJ030_MR4G024742 [Morella rubra]|uniref:Uncharacterized protein n=1 Tax=Morella rubra TaxID=262757 RepID=A0A6A1WS21_9ROSI|nr:hypothetical protein CJ030_MR4G024742 [Morella rubra]